MDMFIGNGFARTRKKMFKKTCQLTANVNLAKH
jgi:hypothetical protein